MRSAADLFEEINALDESVQIEAKKASEIGKSVLQTVCAFANEPGLGGGYLLLGADWKRNEKGDVVYWPAGLEDPDKIQRDLATQCAGMFNLVLRPEMQVESVDGKPMIVVFMPEADAAHKPVYFKATGLPGGAYRRIGSADHRCTDEDLWVLRGETQPQSGPDMAVMHDAAREDFDPQAIAEYRRLRDRGLLVKQGSGSRTYYTLRDPLVEPDPHPEQTHLPLFEDEALSPTSEEHGLTDKGCNLGHATLPPELATLLAEQTGRLDQNTLRQLIIRLCAWRPLTGEELATLLDRKRDYPRNKHLIPMVREGQLKLRYPETVKHPRQAYVATLSTGQNS